MAKSNSAASKTSKPTRVVSVKPAKPSKASQPAALVDMYKHEYNGNKLIGFGKYTDSPADRYNLSFGASKASALLHAIAANGIGTFLATVGEIANGTLSNEDREALGLPLNVVKK